MERLYYQRPGTAPATLELPPAHVGRPPVMRLMEYDAQVLNDRTIENVHDLPEDPESRRVRWLNVGGLGDVELLRRLGQHFHIHPLALEDTLDPSQRPKLAHLEYLNPGTDPANPRYLHPSPPEAARGPNEARQ